MGCRAAHRLALLTEETGKTPSFLYLFGPRLRGKFGSQGLAWINGFEPSVADCSAAALLSTCQLCERSVVGRSSVLRPVHLSLPLGCSFDLGGVCHVGPRGVGGEDVAQEHAHPLVHDKTRDDQEQVPDVVGVERAGLDDEGEEEHVLLVLVRDLPGDGDAPRGHDTTVAAPGEGEEEEPGEGGGGAEGTEVQDHAEEEVEELGGRVG